MLETTKFLPCAQFPRQSSCLGSVTALMGAQCAVSRHSPQHHKPCHDLHNLRQLKPHGLTRQPQWIFRPRAPQSRSKSCLAYPPTSRQPRIHPQHLHPHHQATTTIHITPTIQLTQLLEHTYSHRRRRNEEEARSWARRARAA